jgi:hypothetical protein
MIVKKFFRESKAILTIIVLIALVICCETEEDFRDKYLGNWKFHVEESSFSMVDSLYSKDSFIYNGKISYGKTENELLIEYDSVHSLTLMIDKKGLLFNFPTGYSNGEFYGSDSIHIYLRWGGLGWGSTHIVNGNKK